MSVNKKEFISFCLQLAERKLDNLLLIQNDLSSSLLSETKSTAGDKHETARAMIQLEQEKLGRQIKEGELMKEQLRKLVHSENLLSKKQFIETNKGLFFVYVHLGKISYGEQTVMGISAVSPLGKELLQSEKGSSVRFNGETYLIQEKY